MAEQNEPLDIGFKLKPLYIRLYRGYKIKNNYHPYSNRLLVIGIFNKFFYFDLKKV